MSIVYLKVHCVIIHVFFVRRKVRIEHFWS